MRVYWNENPVMVQKTYVYPAPYLERHAANFVSFCVEKAGWLKIQFDYIPKKIKIRPASLQIPFELRDEAIMIDVKQSCSFSIEIDGNPDAGIMVFACEKPVAEIEAYTNIIRFEAGKHYVDTVTVEKDNTLIVLEENAYVSGKIYADGRRNVCITGIGTLTMENYERASGFNQAIDIKNCKNVHIQGVTVTDSCNWSVRIWGCEDVVIDGIHVISQRGNGDGIDICGCRNVVVKNCFTRVWDDSLVVKAFDTDNVDNILFENCVLWNDFAKPIEVGMELRADSVRNVRFRNIDVIHSATGYPIMGVHHGDRAQVRDILFENIRVEDAPSAQIFDLRIADSVWNKDSSKGDIRNVTFRNISFYEHEEMPSVLSNSRIQGMNAHSCIDNVVIDNIRICGKAVTNREELHLDVYNDVFNLIFMPVEDPKVVPVKTRLEVADEFMLQPDGMYSGTLKLTAINISSTYASSEIRLQMVPSNRASYDGRSFQLELAPGATFEKTFPFRMPPGKFVVEVQSNSPDIISDFLLLDHPLVLGAEIDCAASYSFADCFGNEAGDAQFAIKNDRLILKSELLKKHSFEIYGAIPVETEEGQVLFSVEETDFGKAPGLIYQDGAVVQAPQLRCPEEITYVFRNEPKVEKIFRQIVSAKINGISSIGLEKLGVGKDCNTFWMEVSINDLVKKRYPFCMFGSQRPDQMAHMFVTVKKRQS